MTTGYFNREDRTAVDVMRSHKGGVVVLCSDLHDDRMRPCALRLTPIQAEAIYMTTRRLIDADLLAYAFQAAMEGPR